MNIDRLNSALTNRYRIERELGAGGMATVYLAQDLRHERQVALKVLKPELGAVLGVERFLSEIKVTANLQHPNLLPLFDSGEADGLLFYVMPYVQGESLRHRIDREKQLPIDETVRIGSPPLLPDQPAWRPPLPTRRPAAIPRRGRGDPCPVRRAGDRPRPPLPRTTCPGVRPVR
jgi:hypothetical protein